MMNYGYYGPRVLITIPSRPAEAEQLRYDTRVGELCSLIRDVVERGPECHVWFTVPTEKGYGNAIRNDWLKRQYDKHFGEEGYDAYLLWDNDFATPALEAPKLIRKILWDGYDVVVGARMGRLNNPRQLARGLMSRTMNRLINLTFRTGMSEHFSGFRAYSRNFVEQALSECSEPHWMFQPESSIVGQQLGMKVTEIPVPYDNTLRPTKLSRLPKDLRDIVPGYFRLVREWK